MSTGSSDTWSPRPCAPWEGTAAYTRPPTEADTGAPRCSACCQGLTLVHFSAQLERILWDRGAFRGCLQVVWEVSGGVMVYQGVFRVYLV